VYRVLEATVAYATLICTFYYYYYYYYVAVVINNTIQSILMSQSEKQLVIVMHETNTMKFFTGVVLHSTGTESSRC